MMEGRKQKEISFQGEETSCAKAKKWESRAQRTEKISVELD